MSIEFDNAFWTFVTRKCIKLIALQKIQKQFKTVQKHWASHLAPATEKVINQSFIVFHNFFGIEGKSFLNLSSFITKILWTYTD